MIGTNAKTGKHLTDLDHLKQSIRDILTTPIGTRVERRDYGSKLFDLVDAPSTQATMINIITATAVALDQWEPRVKLRKVEVTGITPGRVEMNIDLLYLPDGKEVTMEGIVV